MRVSIGAQDVGQHDRIAMIRLRPRHAVALPITRHRKWIDRIHPSAGGPQGRHQQTTAGFDRHRDLLIGGIAVFGEQFQQRAENRQRRHRCAAWRPPARDRRPRRRRGGFLPNRSHRTRSKHAPFSCIRSPNRVGARAALMEGLSGPTPDQPFMTPAHRRGLGLHISGRRPRVVKEMVSCGWLDPLIVDPTPSTSADTPTPHVHRLRKTAAPV